MVCWIVGLHQRHDSANHNEKPVHRVSVRAFRRATQIQPDLQPSTPATNINLNHLVNIAPGGLLYCQRALLKIMLLLTDVRERIIRDWKLS